MSLAGGKMPKAPALYLTLQGSDSLDRVQVLGSPTGAVDGRDLVLLADTYKDLQVSKSSSV